MLKTKISGKTAIKTKNNSQKNAKLVKKNKVNFFIVSHHQIRLIRTFFYGKIFPITKYLALLFSILFIITSLYLAIFWKSKLENIENIALKYGYRAINFNVKPINYRINLYGNQQTKSEEIIAIAKECLIKNQYLSHQSIVEEIKNQIQALPWVKEVAVRLSLQESLNIYIKEHQPFAIWEDAGKKYIISQEARIIDTSNIENFNNLVILSGQDAYKNAQSLFKIISSQNQISQNIYSATWVGGRRWNIRLEDGLLIKMPADQGENIANSWRNFIEIYNMPGSTIGLKTIDLRVEGKIYLEYKQD